jgi:thiol-disulfide isomerase/thioredoxin
MHPTFSTALIINLLGSFARLSKEAKPTRRPKAGIEAKTLPPLLGKPHRNVYFILAIFAACAQYTFAQNSPEDGDASGSSSQASIDAEDSNTDNYVHKWIAIPSVETQPLLGSDKTLLESRKGRITVVFFLASWCEPCQLLIDDLANLEQRYQALNTDFFYVFTHDSKRDAEGFMQEFTLKNGMLASPDAIRTFHNPAPPAIYVSDRHGWLVTRYVKAGSRDVVKLGELLKYLTAI